MKSLIAERVKKTNDKIKAEANKSKINVEKNKAKTRNQNKEVVLEEKIVMKQSKTLMLD